MVQGSLIWDVKNEEYESNITVPWCMPSLICVGDDKEEHMRTENNRDKIWGSDNSG